MSTPKVLADSIVLALAESSDHDGPIPLSDADLKRFNGAEPIYSAIKKTLGNCLAPPILNGATITIFVLRDADKVLPHTLKTYHDELVLTAAQLSENANSKLPRPHSVAIKHGGLVPVLQTASRVNRSFGLEVSIFMDGKSVPVPGVAPSDFYEPDRDEELRKSGTFTICGLMRNDARGHEFFVTENQLRVRLPAGDPRWTWDKVHNVLEEPTMLEATLVRESKANPWTIDESAILIVMPQLPLVA